MIMVCGLPASGKSTYAASLGIRVLEYDSFAERLGSYDELEEERSAVDRLFSLLAGSGMYGVMVDTFHTRASRQKALEACGGADLVIVDTPLDICLGRNVWRKSWLKNEELVQIAIQFEHVSPDEGFKTIQVIKGW